MLAIEPRGFAKENGDVVCQSFLHALPDIGPNKEGVMLENALKFRVHVRSGAFGVKMVDVNVFQFSGTCRLLNLQLRA